VRFYKASALYLQALKTSLEFSLIDSNMRGESLLAVLSYTTFRKAPLIHKTRTLFRKAREEIILQRTVTNSFQDCAKKETEAILPIH
jgi:hypothetical protein